MLSIVSHRVFFSEISQKALDSIFALDEKPAVLLQIHANEDFLNYIRQVGDPATNRTQPPDQPFDFDMLYRVAAETGQPVIGPPMTKDEAAKIVAASVQ